MNKEKSSDNCVICGSIELNNGIPPISNEIMITGLNCICKYKIHLHCFAEWCKMIKNSIAPICLVCNGPARENPGMVNRKPWLLHDVRVQPRLEGNILLSVLRESTSLSLNK